MWQWYVLQTAVELHDGSFAQILKPLHKSNYTFCQELLQLGLL